MISVSVVSGAWCEWTWVVASRRVISSLAVCSHWHTLSDRVGLGSKGRAESASVAKIGHEWSNQMFRLCETAQSGLKTLPATSDDESSSNRFFDHFLEKGWAIIQTENWCWIICFFLFFFKLYPALFCLNYSVLWPTFQHVLLRHPARITFFSRAKAILAEPFNYRANFQSLWKFANMETKTGWYHSGQNKGSTTV